jgi:hypothetical protein
VEEASACSLFSMFSSASGKRSAALSASRSRAGASASRGAISSGSRDIGDNEIDDDVSIHSSISNILVDERGRVFKMRKTSDQQETVAATQYQMDSDVQ